MVTHADPATAPAKLDPALVKLTAILMVGAIASLLDTTIVNVGLDTIARDLHTSVTTAQWVITGYLLSFAMVIPLNGWAIARFGAKATWLTSLSVFLAGSIACGAAWNVGSLVAFRVFQGLGGGMLLPVLTTLLIQAAGGRSLGRLMSTVSLPAVIVPVIGPVVGGLIVSNLSWRWLFYVNVPVCLVAIVAAWRAAPADVPSPQRHPFDLLGLALLSPALALVIYGLSQANGASGFATAGVLVPLAIGVAATVVFAVYAVRRSDRALINLRLLRVRSYAASVTVFFLAGLSLYGPLLLLALFYQEVQGRSVIVTGLILVPQGIGSLLPRTMAGKLTDRIGPRLVVLVSLVLTAVGTLAFAMAGPHTSEWLLAVSLLVRGAGLAGATIAVMAGAFQGVPRDKVPDASSTIRIVQQLGGSFGAAVLAVILAHQLTAHAAVTAAARATAFDTAFWWSIGFTVLALLPAFLLPRISAKKANPAGGQTAAKKVDAA
jgi:EmrB/QacA subfamily drug resistance transporter